MALEGAAQWEGQSALLALSHPNKELPFTENQGASLGDLDKLQDPSGSQIPERDV